jgi:hypothetical protein
MVVADVLDALGRPEREADRQFRRPQTIPVPGSKFKVAKLLSQLRRSNVYK